MRSWILVAISGATIIAPGSLEMAISPSLTTYFGSWKTPYIPMLPLANTSAMAFAAASAAGILGIWPFGCLWLGALLQGCRIHLLRKYPRVSVSMQHTWGRSEILPRAK